MPFYFRIPLPGPFGYSKRIGGKRRKSVRQPVPRLTRAERQEQHEQAARRNRMFIAVATQVEHGADGSLSFLALFDVNQAARNHRPAEVLVTIPPGENDSARWEIAKAAETGSAAYLPVTFRPDMRTVESVEGIT
jgi:hypothetical protein